MENVSQISRTDLWYREYRSSPYLRCLSQKDLEERLADVMTNVMTLKESGQIGVDLFNSDKKFCWMELLAHIFCEFQLRASFVSDNVLGNLCHPPKPTFLKNSISFSICSDLNSSVKRIFKFGKKPHLQETLERGKIRICPASYYSPEKVENYAVKDDELNLSTHHLIKNDHVLEKTKGQRQDYTFLNRSYKASGDFYIYCLSEKYTQRLFGDFETDSVLIINDLELFKRLVLSAFKEQVGDLSSKFMAVNYIDPLRCLHEEINLAFSKHFKYAYQNECRFVWAPSNSREKIEPIYINIGSMKKYAELRSI